ncbi:inositol polyphosphate phosphatase [Cantharellus anzutake]|uniref:inositol polyphosphate phosphatase n=1 Tax=Cantharellus anzutake TaxID=1750568 RepID=UPI001905695F|nr:inositol polyphosphate phosphatase [Cantharellus anzutake]KAF8343971.1 inositol polyphosphate phosphatase [Cantharellus anzutake]
MASHTLVHICSYNSNMQGDALAQDLVDWLAPTLTTSTFLANQSRTPDLVVVGFQELLPLHLGFTGRSGPALNSRDKLIRRTIEEHNKAPYSLVAKFANVGVAILVYAKDEENGLARRIRDVETEWAACGPMWLGNKGAVGIRFRVVDSGSPESAGEIYTFVNAHLTAHAQYLEQRVQNFQHIARTMLFKPVHPSTSNIASTIYDTTHLFFFGDLNFRISPPPPKALTLAEIIKLNTTVDGRRELIKHDQLKQVMAEGRVGFGLREGEVEQFPLSYKYDIGSVTEYNACRVPSWTDRILYTTASDEPSNPTQSNIKNILYTTILAFTKSDHKPVTALLLVPSPPAGGSRTSPALLTPPPAHLDYVPYHSHKLAGKVIGKALDYAVGSVWFTLWALGAGHAGIGIVNAILVMIAIIYWKSG